MTRAPLLELRDVKVERGGVQVLDVPSFRLGEHEFVSVIGPNGSGKSTLLLSIMCLLDRSAGAVLYRGREVDAGDAVAHRRRLAMVFQEPLLFDATVEENVASGLRIRGVQRSDARRTVAAFLERFGLAPLARRSARKLSGGEARRVSLARALAVRPEVMLLDEPFANLDPPTRQSIGHDLEAAIRDGRISAVLVTHDRAEALRMSDRIDVMERGRIVQSGPPAAVANHPANEFVASCVGMETIVEGVVARASGRDVEVLVNGTTVHAIADAAPGEVVFCCIAPENVLIHVSDPAARTSARNALPATIASVTSLGAYLKLELDCGFPLTAHVTGASYTALGLATRPRVFASFKATSVHLVRKADATPAAS